MSSDTVLPDELRVSRQEALVPVVLQGTWWYTVLVRCCVRADAVRDVEELSLINRITYNLRYRPCCTRDQSVCGVVTGITHSPSARQASQRAPARAHR